MICLKEYVTLALSECSYVTFGTFLGLLMLHMDKERRSSLPTMYPMDVIST